MDKLIDKKCTKCNNKIKDHLYSCKDFYYCLSCITEYDKEDKYIDMKVRGPTGSYVHCIACGLCLDIYSYCKSRTGYRYCINCKK
jgi:hypothetical protein